MTNNEHNYIYPGFREINSNQPKPSETDQLKLPIPTSIKQSLEFYKTAATTDQINDLNSTVFRYLVPALGGEKPKGKRISDSEKSEALALLDSIPFAKVKDLPDLLEEELKKQNIDAKKAKKARSYLKRFIKWTQEQKWIEEESTKPDQYYRFKETKKSRPYAGDSQVMPGRPTSKDRQKIDFDDLNEKAQKQLTEFEDFFKKNHYRKTTTERDTKTYLRALGWLHFVKKVPLEDLDLTSLVFYSPHPQTFRRKNFNSTNEYYTAKIEAEEAMKDNKKETLQLWEDFLNQTKTTKQTQITYLKSAKNLGMFLYREDTENSRVKGGYKDIAVIEGIRDLQNHLTEESKKESRHRIPPEKRRIPWGELLNVPENFRIEFEQEHRYHLRHTRQRKDGTIPKEKIKRADRPRGINLMKFLILNFYIVIPPGRPRDYIELEIGKTFLQGCLVEGTFYPISKMHDPEKAQWWIKLNPDEYKTGAQYGHWQVQIPNLTYKNGKTLYEYIDLWINYYRDVFNPNHNCLFTNQKGKPLPNLALVKNAINRFTGTPVNPQNIRHMFVTYLRNQGATEEQLDSAATAMRHSRKTQQQVYDLQDRQEKMETILNYAKQIAQDHLNNCDHSA